jgi:hypothetical protein
MINRMLCCVAVALALTLTGCKSGGAHAGDDACCTAHTCKGCGKTVACGDEMMKCPGCGATMKCGDMTAKCAKCGAEMKCSEMMAKDKGACCKDGKHCCSADEKGCVGKCPKCGGEMKCDMSCPKCKKPMQHTSLCADCCAKQKK